MKDKGGVRQFLTSERNSAAALLFMLVCLSGYADAQTITNRSPVVVWDTSARLTTGFGYRDNVLRSSVATESSTFFLTSADATFIRLTDSGSLFTLFLLGEDTRYFDAPVVDYEQLFSGSAQFTTPAGADAELGIYANYLYQHQVLDVSETEANLRRVLVNGHGLTLRPHWKKSLAENWDLQVTGTAFRQMYETQLDDFWEGGGQLSIIRSYGQRSELVLYYQFLRRYYDTREQFDIGGVMIPGADLVYEQSEAGSQWRQHWDKARQWRSTTRLSYLCNHDNGSGYFDYDRLLFSEQLRWKNDRWEIRATARFGWYYYDVQRIGPESRERSYAAVDFHVEHRWSKHWLAFAEAEQEWNLSNDPLDEYNVWMASAGIVFEF